MWVISSQNPSSPSLRVQVDVYRTMHVIAHVFHMTRATVLATALVIVPVFVIVPVTVRVTAPVYLVDSDNSKGKHFRLDYLPSTRLR